MTDTIQPIVEPEVSAEISYEQYGDNWIRRILHKDRILELVSDVLGEKIELGPIGAGPGRKYASFSVVGTYREPKGEEVPAEVLTYRIYLPIGVAIEVDMKVDRHRFDADVVVPLLFSVHTEEPVRLRCDIATPSEDDVVIKLTSATRRGSIFQKLAGLEDELRRFLVKVVRTELDKPYVRRATHLDMEQIIDGAWPALTAQFLPQGPEDRAAPD